MMKFSIVIPAYNYGHLLPRALESALSQSGQDFEILVIDDGSPDNTPQVMADYLEKYPGQIRYIRQKNEGSASARNRGVRESIGEYLIFLDADDRLLPDALCRFRMFLANKGDYGMVFGGHVSTHPDGRTKTHLSKPLSTNREENFLRYIRKEFGISNGATIMARKIFDKVRYPEHLRNSEDIPVFAQVLALYDCASFPEPVLEIFKHGDSLRNNIELVMKTGTSIVDILFDPAILPARLLSYQSEFLARQNLSLFRSLYLAGHYAESRFYYYQGIKAYPSLLGDFSYFSKFVRSFFQYRQVDSSDGLQAYFSSTCSQKMMFQSIEREAGFQSRKCSGFRIQSQSLPEMREILELLLPDPDPVLLGGELFKQGSRNFAGRIEVQGRSYFLKRFNCRGPLYRFVNAFRASRAIRTWRVSWRFRKMGISVPEPVLCMEERCCRLLGRAYLLTEFVDGAQPLHEVWPLFSEEERIDLLIRFADILGRMHSCGGIHGDLKWNNLLVRKEQTAIVLTLVDVDGSYVSRRPSLKRAHKDIRRFLKDLNEVDHSDGTYAALFNAHWRQKVLAMK